MSGQQRHFDRDFLGSEPRRSKVHTRHQKKMEHIKNGAQRPPFRHVPLFAQIEVRAALYPTEERVKVERAVLALLPDAKFESPAKDGRVTGRAGDLTRLAQIVRHARIRDTAREVLRHSIGQDGVIRFYLNKQAATAARVNFALPGGEPLGSLDVEIRAREPESLIEELTWIEGESDERLFGTRKPNHAGRGPGGRPGR